MFKYYMRKYTMLNIDGYLKEEKLNEILKYTL